MTGDISQLTEIQNYNGGYVSFTGRENGKITQRGTVTNGILQFENVNFIPELKHSLLSVSQICDKDFSAHFTNNACLILKTGVIIPDEWVLVRPERKNDAYIIDMNHNIPENITCLLSKTNKRTAKLWHRCLGHVNAKNLNRIAKTRSFVVCQSKILSLSKNVSRVPKANIIENLTSPSLSIPSIHSFNFFIWIFSVQ